MTRLLVVSDFEADDYVAIILLLGYLMRSDAEATVHVHITGSKAKSDHKAWYEAHEDNFVTMLESIEFNPPPDSNNTMEKKNVTVTWSVELTSEIPAVEFDATIAIGPMYVLGDKSRKYNPGDVYAYVGYNFKQSFAKTKENEYTNVANAGDQPRRFAVTENRFNEAEIKSEGTTFKPQEFETTYVVDQDHFARVTKTVAEYLDVDWKKVNLINNTYKHPGDELLNNIVESGPSEVVNSLPESIVQILKGFEATTPELFSEQIQLGNNPPKFKHLLKVLVYAKIKDDRKEGLPTYDQLINAIETSDPNLSDYIKRISEALRDSLQKASPLWADTLAVSMYIYKQQHPDYNSNLSDAILLADDPLGQLTSYLTDFISNNPSIPKEEQSGGRRPHNLWLTTGLLALATLLASALHP